MRSIPAAVALSCLLLVVTQGCRTPAPSNSGAPRASDSESSVPATQPAAETDANEERTDPRLAHCKGSRDKPDTILPPPMDAIETFMEAERLLTEEYLPLLPAGPIRSQAEFEAALRAIYPVARRLDGEYHEMIGATDGPLDVIARLRSLQLNGEQRELWTDAFGDSGQQFAVPLDIPFESLLSGWELESASLVELAYAQCMDTVWTRSAYGSILAMEFHPGAPERFRYTLTRWPRLAACPATDAWTPYADVDPILIATLRKRFESTLKSYRTPTTPSIHRDVDDADAEIRRLVTALVPLLRGLSERYAGPNAIEAHILLAEVYVAWADAIEDVPAPQSLFRDPQAFQAHSPLSQWEATREKLAATKRAEAPKVLDGALRDVERYCLGDETKARLEAARAALGGNGGGASPDRGQGRP